ncbi:MAG: hypothetical protein U9R37_05715 [Campylobacterota bacterium]|nr:hypothetical protein [Campylobacterota bacterium]
MASDLSTIIKNGLESTLHSLLAKDAKIIQTTRTHQKDFDGFNMLKVDSIFEFSNFSSTFTFYVPAVSSSHIFNIQMGTPDAEPSHEIDDDITDAIGEFISNISGGLTTAINAESLEDLGSSKFNIGHKEVATSELQIDTNNIFKFLIDLEGTEIIIFIHFEDNLIEYIEDIAKSEVTFYEEETKEEEIEEEKLIETPDEEKQIVEKENEEPKKEETVDENEIEISDEEKQKNKLKKIIIIVAGLLITTILAGITMYILGMFDQPEPIVKKVESNTTKTQDKIEVVKYNTLKKVDFDTNSINKKRLNARLESLTKFEILNEEELNAQKLEQKNRLKELEKEKEFIEFSKNNKEEDIFDKQPEKKLVIVDKKTKFSQETYNEEIDKKTEEVEVDNKLNFITTNSLKYRLFKKLLLESKTKQARISVCNDQNGKTTIFIGPFIDKTAQIKMQNLIKKENSDLITNLTDIIQEEFEIQCSVE